MIDDGDLVTRKAGETVFREGEEGSIAYVVQTGVVELVRKRGDSEEVVGSVGAGGLLGGVTIADGQPYPEMARALTPVTLIVVLAETYRNRLKKSDPLVIAVTTDLARQIRAEGRRRHRRVSVDLPAEVQLADQAISARVIDISIGGARLNQRIEPPPGNRFQVRIGDMPQIICSIVGLSKTSTHLSFEADLAARQALAKVIADPPSTADEDRGEAADS